MKDKKRITKTKEGVRCLLVFRLLKLQYVHKLQTGGTHHIDLVHLMTKKIEEGEWGHFESRPNKVTHKHSRHMLLL